MQRQRRIVSLIEALFNTAVGFGLSVGIGVVVYPIFGHSFDVIQLTGITAIFTVVSVVRGYIVRRTFVWAKQKGLR